MQTKDDILREMKRILSEMFEIEEDAVTPEAKLYEELDLDSIDAIDLIITLQELTGKKVRPEQFKSVRSVQDVVDVVFGLIQNGGGLPLR